MAKRKSARPSTETRAVTAERAARLHNLLRLMDKGPQSRQTLSRKLKLDVRGFYRDLELLRASGILLPMSDGQYILEEKADAAIARLPFPDPHLTLGEAAQLAKGRSEAHKKIRSLLQQIVKPTGGRKGRK